MVHGPWSMEQLKFTTVTCIIKWKYVVQKILFVDIFIYRKLYTCMYNLYKRCCTAIDIILTYDVEDMIQHQKKPEIINMEG